MRSVYVGSTSLFEVLSSQRVSQDKHDGVIQALLFCAEEPGADGFVQWPNRNLMAAPCPNS
jgi:hypothetical protein